MAVKQFQKHLRKYENDLLYANWKKNCVLEALAYNKHQSLDQVIVLQVLNLCIQVQIMQF